MTAFPNEVPRSGRPARILIADDDPGVRELLREMVEGLGYAAVTVPDGVAALNAIAAERPDLILMDLQLPDMTGYEATRDLKANSDTASIPVVAMTAQAMRGVEERARDAGCDGYPTKPLEAREFREVLRRHLPRSDKGTG